MATKTIHDYTAAATMDGAADYLLIDPSSTGVYKKISRNVLLGVTGTPADLSTTQTFTNKVLDNSNTLTLRRDRFTLQDSADTTKQASFILSGITTATTRTYTLPNNSSTLVDLITTQTLTNKTLTSPTITGGSMDNTTITVDSIAEHTAGNGVTVGGVKSKNGVITTSGAVTSTSLALANVQPQHLVASTGTGWAFQSWTPTWTNLTVGNGILSTKYAQIGKTVVVYYSFSVGTTSAVGSDPQFTLPVTASSAYLPDHAVGVVRLVDAGVAGYLGAIYLPSTTKGRMVANNAAGTYLADATITAAVPFAWGAGDSFAGSFTYEAA